MTDCIILAGGLGTRLRGLTGDVIKPMVPVNGVPFLAYIVRQAQLMGFQRFIFAVGHRAEQIESYFGTGEKWGISIIYSPEGDHLLGTGGGVKKGFGYVETEFALVMNGDSLCLADFKELIDVHERKHTPVTILGAHVENVARFGSMKVDSEGMLLNFVEKTGTGTSGLINAGVYVIRKSDIVSFKSPEAFSLEHDYFEVLPHGSIAVYESHAPFIDIGIPEDLVRLPSFLKQALGEL